MNPDGTGVRQLTFNDVDDAEPVLSPDDRNVAYMSRGDRTSNPQGDYDVYGMKALDGTGKKNLSKNKASDYSPD
jgi:Tol biopolymer transport system component